MPAAVFSATLRVISSASNSGALPVSSITVAPSSASVTVMLTVMDPLAPDGSVAVRVSV